MFLINIIRNIININPTIRRFFIILVSKFSVPLLKLKLYSSIKGGRRQSLWSKGMVLFKELNLEKYIVSKDSTIFYYKNGTAFNIQENQSSLSRILLFQPIFCPNETAFISKFVKPGWTALDIGANFGWFSIYLSRWVGTNGKVLSFEPVPESYEELNSNININSTQNTKTFNIALGNKKGYVSFGVPDFDLGLCAASEFLNTNKQIQVEMKKLDDLIEEQNLNRLDFIKADIEGGELNMLHGAEKTIGKFRPDIFIEIVDLHCHRFGYSSLDVFQFLTNKGYIGMFVGNDAKDRSNKKIDLIKPNMKNLLNGNYIFTCEK